MFELQSLLKNVSFIRFEDFFEHKIWLFVMEYL